MSESKNEFIDYNGLTTFLSNEGRQLLDEVKFIERTGKSSGMFNREDLKRIFDSALNIVNKNNNINYLCEIIMELRGQILSTIIKETED